MSSMLSLLRKMEAKLCEASAVGDPHDNHGDICGLRCGGQLMDYVSFVITEKDLCIVFHMENSSYINVYKQMSKTDC